MTTPIDSVYLDVDGVLVDFVAGALAACGARAEVLKPGQWEIYEAMGLSEEEFWSRCCGHDFWRKLRWTTDGVWMLCEMRKLGLPLWLLTSPTDDPGCYSGKYSWLCCHLPHLRRRANFCPDKRAVARPGALLIDDCDLEVEQWRSRGGEAVLVPRKWNSLHHAAGYSAAHVERRLNDLFRNSPDETG